MSRQEQNDRHIIWSDIHLNFEDWRADLEEQYPDLSEDELVQKMADRWRAKSSPVHCRN